MYRKDNDTYYPEAPDPQSGEGEVRHEKGHIGESRADIDTPSGESGEDDVRSGESKGHGPSSWNIFLRLFVAPLAALKRLKNSNLAPEKVAAAVFYPLVALSSAGIFMRMVYEEGPTVSTLLKEAVGEFISFFLGYYLVLVVLRVFLPGDAGEKTDLPYGRSWLMYLMSTLALYDIVIEIFPPLEPVVAFAPLYTIYLSLRGSRFLRCRKTSNLVAGWAAALSTIFIPYGLQYLMKFLMGGDSAI